MSVLSEQWIQDSLARLESLEQERIELGAALSRAAERKAGLVCAAEENQRTVAEVERELERLGPARSALEARAEELAHRRAALEERLGAVQSSLAEVRLEQEEVERDRRRLESNELQRQALDRAGEQRARLAVELHDVERTRASLGEAVAALDHEIAGLYRALQAVAEEGDPPAPPTEGRVAAELDIGDTRPQPVDDDRGGAVVSGVIDVSSLEAAREPLADAGSAARPAGVVAGEFESKAEEGAQEVLAVPQEVVPATTAPFLLPRADPLAQHPLRVTQADDVSDSVSVATADDGSVESPKSRLVLERLPRPGADDPVLPRPPTVSSAQ